MTDIHRLFGSLAQARTALELKTTDLCFLIALRDRARQQGLATFDEQSLFDLYEQTGDAIEGDRANARKSATHAIQRLRDQRLLSRVDGAGLLRAGDYTLTRLATAIVDYYLEDDALTRESLTVLTRSLRSQLSEVRSGAERAQTVEQWREAVTDPLSIAVRDLVAGIERRTRGLDAHQQAVREEISGLLQQDWFASIDTCESLLEETTATLRELADVLLHDTAQLQGLLQEIEELARLSGAAEAEEAARNVMTQLDFVVAWSANRQGAWSDYYQFVQRYLRSVVRLDPDRALSQRLREHLAAFVDDPFYLLRAQREPLWLLHEPEIRPERTPVVRPRREHEPPLTRESLDTTAMGLEAHIEQALAAGARSLSEVLGRVLPILPPSERFGAAGRIAEILATNACVSSLHERPWVRVGTEMEVEEWTIERGEKP
jgi:chromosome partition protein MukF